MTDSDHSARALESPDPPDLRLRAGGNAVTLDLSLGNIAALDLGGIAPLHRAPWLDEPEVQADTGIAMVERRLSGDFFCMPFGGNDVEPGPIHGWTANSPWSVIDRGDGAATLGLDRPVFGATVRREVRIAGDAPILYQRHRISGGQGEVTFAHHPMVSFASGSRFFCSPKRVLITAETPLEPGRNRLSAGADCRDLTAVPASDGGTVDLSRLPIGTAHEDFVTLVEDAGRQIGWTAILREAEDDIVFFLKNAELMPVTMLWHSNAGRDYAPWNGRHRNVLGVEDGRAAGELGHAGALEASVHTRNGIPTTLTLGGEIIVPHVTGAIPRPRGWHEITDIRVSGDRLTIAGGPGQEVVLPFEAGFLDLV
ncbi:hypothetical protein JQU17_12240 [Ponticoccus sp. SC2-23]|uniref:hypothetical protein n=1 Tax=Alexandriicola marinus TaxID=2081710 RepID=UPI000FDC6605|nr:hypothetical protein [Alexandriicola marinus]MBM1221666.1 hypothetical protein [Ponticoccus sp. SC6-9]MBM1226707.1 hypothetical protein [Ponticoccus sp. SC6-15]MBM1230658.1 hypothetical protein [Ponticoccus sp. SC6-38]MBM1235181.1 hypothetical protein [Ponticoccus sp. SC6-45]MBM1239679.1 hypothetical protein [Ponticoccus sp. SC6-49]MBM1243461.1 hypothetical protein [Ponticoccus sp. SC2-64]MBM1248705.1 hypothetical protein [Ponticoccus sp. SC6-42]MBM1253290.1 hypothetical protein [Pontico